MNSLYYSLHFYMFAFFHICLLVLRQTLAFALGLNLITTVAIILNPDYVGHFILSYSQTSLAAIHL